MPVPVADPEQTARSHNGRRPLHVCLVVHARYPIGEPRAERAAQAALRAGHRVSVIALRADGEPSEESVDGVEVRRLPVTHARGASVAQMVWEYVGFALLATLATLRHHRRR